MGAASPRASTGHLAAAEHIDEQFNVSGGGLEQEPVAQLLFLYCLCDEVTAPKSKAKAALDAVYERGSSKITGKKRPNEVKETELQQAVAKSVSGALKWASHYELRHKLVDGQTLIDTVTEAKRRRLQGESIVFGKFYYEDLRCKWGGSEDPVKLIGKPKKDDLCDAVKTGMTGLLREPPNRSYMRGCADMLGQTRKPWALGIVSDVVATREQPRATSNSARIDSRDAEAEDMEGSRMAS
eukprot:6490466-Amphidinium_carterae.1